MILRERLALWPTSVERAALVGGDAPGLRSRMRTMPCICNARAKRVPARGMQAVGRFVSAAAPPRNSTVPAA